MILDHHVWRNYCLWSTVVPSIPRAILSLNHFAWLRNCRGDEGELLITSASF